MSASVKHALISTGSMSSAREMRAWKRAKAIEAAGVRRVAAPPKPNPDFQPVEFNLPGESRDIWVSCGYCPQCGAGWVHVLEIRIKRHQRNMYRLRCQNDHCTHATPEFTSSQLAIRHWKLVAALSK